MRRGEVWWIAFGGSLGGEIQKTRPGVIVSNDASNQHANRVQIVPLSSNTDKIYPCEAKVRIGGKESKAMADQIVTVSKDRLTTQVASLSEDDMRSVEIAIRIQLGLAA
jgi:mRNA interferase MazF